MSSDRAAELLAGPPVLAVVGPTAVGKSEVAIALAQRLGGEVINADAMQVYRGMDIGTAKVPVGERSGVVHHLLDLLEVTESATVAEFQVLARAAVADCQRRGVVPVLVGGSALYVRAVLDDFEFPGTDPALRAALEHEATEAGLPALHARLAAIDPAAAAAILPTNARRVLRALEVIELTGRPFAATLPGYEYLLPAVQVGLQLDRPTLDERIAARVERMWANGLPEEVRRLLDAGFRVGRTAPRALGYSQALRYLDGELDRASAIEETVRATRRFARRQDSWFRKDPRVHWVPALAADRVERALTYYRLT